VRPNSPAIEFRRVQAGVRRQRGPIPPGARRRPGNQLSRSGPGVSLAAGSCSLLHPAARLKVNGALAGGLIGRALRLPRNVKHWSLTTLREKLVKIGAKVTRHSKYVTFRLAEVAVTRNLFAAILDRIERLTLPPPVVVGCVPEGG